MKESEVLMPMLDAIIASDRETDGHPVLPEGSWAATVLGLQIHLVWHNLLQHYLGELHKRLGGQVRHMDLLPEETHQRVCDEGLVVLEESELARLALNPVALAAILGHHYVPRGLQSTPAPWREAQEAVVLIMMGGVELARRFGFRAPPDAR